MRLNFLLIFSSFLVLSCGQNDAQKNTQDPLWDLEQQVFEKGENIEVTEINKSLEKATTMRLSWAYSPITIAIRVAGQQMISPEVKILAKSKSGNELITHAVVMIEKKNLQDDSVNNEYYRVELKLGGSLWQVMDIKKAWSCKANRGHSEVNSELCK
jgi:enoyl-[acyl-carrier-protein] reductase (NADH)